MVNINHPNRSRKTRRVLVKRNPDAPALIATGPRSIAIRAGTSFGGHRFSQQTEVAFPQDLVIGADYGVVVGKSTAQALRAFSTPMGRDVLGGFHFAPGGNAPSRAGGDDIPVINPCSIWDIDFRPACPDPRGMALVEAPGKRFWCDIYLTGVDHLKNGTSTFGVKIADGNSCPIDPATGSSFRRFDYAAATAVMKHHGKGLLGLDEFPHAFFGVTERTSAKTDPDITGLDAPRTSRFGLMQATGNLWVWGHDGDPDTPRASIFGGSWFKGSDSGSRYACVATLWPDYSFGDLGARGRSDHLQPVSRRGSDGMAA